MRRLFIAINIPEDIRKKISKKKEALESLIPGASFVSSGGTHITPDENWHLTLVFLGYQEDEAILPIIKSMEDVADSFDSPEITLEDISYAPPKGTPRMIWLNGASETSKSLGSLKIALEDELIKNKVRFKLENREFNSHITLARFTPAPENQVSGFTEIPKKELPEIGREFKNLDWFFMAGGIDLMESHLSKNGARYELLQHIDFGGN